MYSVNLYVLFSVTKIAKSNTHFTNFSLMIIEYKECSTLGWYRNSLHTSAFQMLGLQAYNTILDSGTFCGGC